MNITVILFVVGLVGFVQNRQNLLIILLSLEIILVSITFLVLVSSYKFDDIQGQVNSLYIIAIAGAESAIGLGILVAYYRLRGNILINNK